jgi:hypothetical protein
MRHTIREVCLALCGALLGRLLLHWGGLVLVLLLLIVTVLKPIRNERIYEYRQSSNVFSRDDFSAICLHVIHPRCIHDQKRKNDDKQFRRLAQMGVVIDGIYMRDINTFSKLFNTV